MIITILLWGLIFLLTYTPTGTQMVLNFKNNSFTWELILFGTAILFGFFSEYIFDVDPDTFIIGRDVFYFPENYFMPVKRHQIKLERIDAYHFILETPRKKYKLIIEDTVYPDEINRMIKDAFADRINKLPLP